MIVIQDVLISDELIENKFVCNLNACKGACCWEGDFGAPADEDEIAQIQTYNEVIASFLPEVNQKLLMEDGGFTYYEEAEINGTTLLPDGSCVYLAKDDFGIATCSIEKAYKLGLIPVNKPISCHLYPIRVSKNEFSNFEAWNYDEWEICSAACSLGESLQVPVYQFLKESITRYKGQDFYDELVAAAKRIGE